MIHSPGGFGRASRLSGLRVLDEALPVPDQAADVQLVVEETGAAGAVAADGAVAPALAARAGDSLHVQPLGDRLGRAAGGEFGEDPPHDRGLLRHDAPLAVDRPIGTQLAHYRIAVAEPAGAAVGPHSAFQPAPGLLRQILEVERVHGTLEPDVEIADLALSHGDDPHAQKTQPLEQGGRVLLVAAQPIQALRQHHVHAAGAHKLQHRLVARPPRRGGARHSVGEALDHLRPEPLRQLPAETELVLDRSLALLVAGVARVDDGVHALSSGLRRPRGSCRPRRRLTSACHCCAAAKSRARL